MEGPLLWRISDDSLRWYGPDVGTTGAVANEHERVLAEIGEQLDAQTLFLFDESVAVLLTEHETPGLRGAAVGLENRGSPDRQVVGDKSMRICAH
jgi:hypothetical protein